MSIYELYPHRKWDIDSADRQLHVIAVRAQSEDRARELVAIFAGNEGEEVWLDPDITACEPIDPNGPEMVLASEYE